MQVIKKLFENFERSRNKFMSKHNYSKAIEMT